LLTTSASTARVSGARLLTNPVIAAMIAEKQAALADRLEISAERVLQEYAAIAFADIGDVAHDDGAAKSLASMRRSQRVAIAEIASTEHGRRVRMHDKRAALADLAKHLGLFEKDNEQRGTRVLNAIIVPAKGVAGTDNHLGTDAPPVGVSFRFRG